MMNRRTLILLGLTIVVLYAIYHNSGLIQRTSSSLRHSEIPPASHLSEESTKSQQSSSLPSPELLSSPATPLSSDETKPKTEVQVNGNGAAGSPLSPHVLTYFDQAFSLAKPAPYNFPALREQCQRTEWPDQIVYLQCGGMSAGLTTIMSQLKVCLKMAIDAGTGIILPAMPLRDSSNLKEFNLMNSDAYLTYDEWFDGEFFKESIERACPQMKILHPSKLDKSVEVKHRWKLDIEALPGYKQFNSYFWIGRPFKAFFDEQYLRMRQANFLDPNRDDIKQGITLISVDSHFLLYKITDDPTGGELRLWNDLSHLIRFREAPRKIVNQLLAQLNQPFYGVHFRVESDTIWSSLDHQLGVDLDALDQAWAKYGKTGAKKPLVYLACGDQKQVEKFVLAGKARGWEVTHKWLLAQSNAETLKGINDLPFDFQGAVDMGVMVKSDFFLGITGSAFSSTIANVRDATGRYRGSSFLVFDDGNARTHLFNDGDSSHYSCCL